MRAKGRREGTAIREAGVRAKARSLFKAVADTANGLNQLAVGAELFSQADDLDIDSPVGDQVVLAMEPVDNLVTGEDNSGPFGEHVKDIEFGKGEAYRLVVDEDLSASGVYGHAVSRDG